MYHHNDLTAEMCKSLKSVKNLKSEICVGKVFESVNSSIYFEKDYLEQIEAELSLEFTTHNAQCNYSQDYQFFEGVKNAENLLTIL